MEEDTEATGEDMEATEVATQAMEATVATEESAMLMPTLLLMLMQMPTMAMEADTEATGEDMEATEVATQAMEATVATEESPMLMPTMAMDLMAMEDTVIGMAAMATVVVMDMVGAVNPLQHLIMEKQMPDQYFFKVPVTISHACDESFDLHL